VIFVTAPQREQGTGGSATNEAYWTFAGRSGHNPLIEFKKNPCQCVRPIVTERPERYFLH